MTFVWLQTGLVIVLALAAWICGIDATGNSTNAAVLWTAAALGCAPIFLSLLPRAG